MPLYQWKCKQCEEKLENLLTFKELDAFEKKCPKCGGELDRDWELGTKIAVHVAPPNNSKEYGGIFSKSFWKKNTWV